MPLEIVNVKLTSKEIIQLRLKCLEPFIATASKTGIEQDVVLRKAENAWKFAIEPITGKKEETTDTAST